MREFDISDFAREAAMNRYDEDRLNKDVLEGVITAINDGTQLFRTEDPTQKRRTDQCKIENLPSTSASCWRLNY